MSRRLGWVLSFLVAACATTGRAVPPTFTYAPPPGSHWVRTVKILTETTLPGSAYRQLEERELVWNIGVSKEGDNTLVTQQLQRLTVRVNGLDLIDGERLPGTNLSVNLVVDRSAHVVEVRGAEDAAKLLSSLVRTASTADPGDQMFTAEVVKEIAVARFEMVVRNVVGHPTAPGSSWDVERDDPTAQPGKPTASGSSWHVEPDDPAVQKKTLTVDKLEACGAATCARVSTQYVVDSKVAARRAMRAGAIFLARNGVNPAEAEVLSATLDYQDEILVEPGTLIDHSGTFSQTAKVTFVGASGQPIPVEFRTALEQSSVFP
jgi:hypothetical protein